MYRIHGGIAFLQTRGSSFRLCQSSMHPILGYDSRTQPSIPRKRESRALIYSQQRFPEVVLNIHIPLAAQIGENGSASGVFRRIWVGSSVALWIPDQVGNGCWARLCHQIPERLPNWDSLTSLRLIVCDCRLVYAMDAAQYKTLYRQGTKRFN